MCLGRCKHAGGGETDWSGKPYNTDDPRGKPAKTLAVYLKQMTLGKDAPKDSGSVSVRRVRVLDEDAGQRIDNYLLRECKGVPKSHIYRILRSGEVRVNGGRISQTYRLKMGDEVRIPPVRVAEPAVAPVSQAVASRHDFRIVFEDDALLVIDKPAGIAVHGGSGLSYGVIEALRAQRPQAKFLELAHRLDRETSGLLIIGKKRAALNVIQDGMRNGGLEKRYLTMVSGRWLNALQHVRAPLYKYLTPEGERRVMVREDGKPSHSIVRLLARWERFSLVEVELKTGRTHQIRVHLKSQGFPLLGDDKYGDFPLNKQLARDGLERMFLHAAKLAFDHPVTSERLQLEAALPSELAAFVRRVDLSQKKDYGGAQF